MGYAGFRTHHEEAPSFVRSYGTATNWQERPPDVASDQSVFGGFFCPWWQSLQDFPDEAYLVTIFLASL